MKKGSRSNKEKLEIVLEGLQGNVSISELCNRHGIGQATYYKWRDKLMAASDVIFAHGGVNRSEERLTAENRKLRTIIGDLTIELKKNL